MYYIGVYSIFDGEGKLAGGLKYEMELLSR